MKTLKEAEEKWLNLPMNERKNLEDDFGILAKPTWIYFAMRYPLTKAGEQL